MTPSTRGCVGRGEPIAVYWAAAFNFLVVFVFGTAAANTIGKGIINVMLLDYLLVFAALAGAVV